MSRNENVATITQGVKPIYLQIREDLLRALRETHSRQLPSEREICQKYNVCRPTVHKALSYFIEKNMIIRLPGKGTFFREDTINRQKTITEIKMIIRHDWQSWEGDSYFGQAIQGVFGVLTQHACNLKIEKFTDTLFYQLLDEPDTATIWLSPEAEENQAIRRLADTDHRVAVINRELNHPGVNWVSSDHLDEGRMAAEYIRNYRQAPVTYICSAAEHDISAERDTGLRRVFAADSIITYNNIIFAAQDWVANLTDAINKFLTANSSPQTLVFNNGSMLPIIVDRLKQSGRNLPDDISLLAFGDSSDAENFGITVVRQPVEKLGKFAAESAAGINQEPLAAKLPCSLFERNSVKQL